VLAIKILWTKTVGKDSTAFDQILAVENAELIGKLKDSKGRLIEVLCSEQPGEKDKVYLRVDKIFKDGKGKENFEQDKANLKPGDANRGHGNEGTQKPQTETKTEKAETKPEAVETKPEKREPLPEIKAEPPVIVEVKRNVTEERKGKMVTVQCVWQNLTGVVVANTGPQAVSGSRSRRVIIGIAGLEDYRKNPQGRHNRFDCWHESLFDALACAQPGAKIVFDYFPETLGPRSNHPGNVTQYIEDVISINGVEYIGGERQEPNLGDPAQHGLPLP